MDTDLANEIQTTIDEIAETERRLYEEAPSAIGANMKRYMKLKEKYNKLLNRYYGGN